MRKRATAAVTISAEPHARRRTRGSRDRSRRLQRRRQTAAACIDGQNGIVDAVRHEDAGPPLMPARRHVTGREGKNVGEQIPIGDSERERIGRAVRKSRDRDPVRIDRTSLEHPAERPVDEGHIRPIAAQDHIPGAPARLRCEDQVAPRFRRFDEAVHELGGLPAGAMQHDQQRSRLGRAATFRHEKEAVAPRGKAEDLNAVRAVVRFHAPARLRVQNTRSRNWASWFRHRRGLAFLRSFGRVVRLAPSFPGPEARPGTHEHRRFRRGTNPHRSILKGRGSCLRHAPE